MEYSFAPLVNNRSKIIILGSLPGMRSLEAQEYYAHPQNRFWRIMFDIFGAPLSCDYAVKCALLLDNGVALWDVVKCAERKGSLDGNIRNETPNDIPKLLKIYPNIHFIIFNGTKACASYKKHFSEPTLPYARLLSTSPACAGRDAERLEAWRGAVLYSAVR